MHRVGQFLFSFAACLALAASALAQDPLLDVSSAGPRFYYSESANATPVRLDVKRTPVLSRRITLDLRNVTLEQALEEIRRLAGLKLMYSTRLIRLGKAVSIKAEDITVASALSEVLFDEEVDVMFSATAQALLVPRNVISATIQMVGRVTGRVTDSATGASISGVNVLIEGSRLGTISASDGSYAIAGIPAGPRVVMARRLGYLTQSRRVTVSDEGTSTIDFVLVKSPTMLTEIVVTPTGDRQRLEVGNAIGTINADSLVPTTLIRNMSDLLTARTPGVIVSNTVGQVGAPSRVRLRGVNSMTLNNDPVIIIDGMRLQAQVTFAEFAGQTNTGSQRISTNGVTTSRLDDFSTSRVDDLDPNTIESIDVLRGPSATSLYGTEASNGVIVIKTKRAGVGPFRIGVLADQGLSYNVGKQSTIWSGWGHLANGQITASCGLSNTLSGSVGPNVVDGTCVQDSVAAYTPTNDPDMTTIGRGKSRNLSLSMSGGSEVLRQYFSMRGSENIGLIKMSNAEARRLERMWGTEPPKWMRKPNSEQSVNASSRTDYRLSSKVDLSLNATGTYRNVLNGAAAMAAAVLGGSASFYRIFDTLSYLPSENQKLRQQQRIKRGVASANVTARPTQWLSMRGTIGADYTIREDQLQQRVQDCTVALAPDGCTGARGVANDQIVATTADIGAVLSFAPRSWLTTRTAFGEQYTHTSFYRLSAGNPSNTQLAFGSELLSPTPVATTTGIQLYSVSESRDESATAGWYLEETAGLRDRLFVTVGLRQDASSAFGAEVNDRAPVYPKYSVSWLVSDEAFFPAKNLIPAFRLRTAYGHSGKQAGQIAVLNNFAQDDALQPDGSAFGAVLAPGIRLSSIGNPNLKPERTTELEGGFDASFFPGERLGIAATIYRKLSRDAIVRVEVPSSYGIQSLGQYINLGSVENRGTELAVNARVWDTPAFSWDVAANMTQNSNKLVSIATAATLDPSSGFKVGYPIFGLFFHQILSYHDLSGDGILSQNEVVFSDTVLYRGAPYPKREHNYHSNMALLNGMLRVNAMFNHVIGLTTSTTNNLGRGSVNTNNRCQYDPTCTLAQQALSLQSRQSGSAEQSNALRFAEFSLTYSLSPVLARRFLRASSASVTLAGRNLALWTNYYGKDPNIAMGASLGGEVARDYGTGLAQPRDFTVRINLGF